MFDSLLTTTVSLILILAVLGLIAGLLVVLWLRRRLRAQNQQLAILKAELRRQSKAIANGQSALDNLGAELEHVTSLIGLTSIQLSDLRSTQPTQTGSVT